jgi:hypothetical protein
MASNKRSFDNSTLVSTSASETSENIEKKICTEESKEAKETKEEELFLKDFYSKFISIPTKSKQTKYLWSSYENEREFLDKSGTKFKIKSCRTEETEAIVLRAPTYRGGDNDWTTKLVEDNCSPHVFRNVNEVVAYLADRASMIQVYRGELNQWNGGRYKMMGLDKKERERKFDEYGSYTPSDEILWKLFVETVKEKRQNCADLCKTSALTMAREFLESDQGLLKLTQDFITTLDKTGGRVIDDHSSSDDHINLNDDSPITLMRKEYLVAPGVTGAYEKSSLVESHNMPAVQICRRTEDIHHRDHDDAWICGFKTHGNPYYVSKKDGLIHISTCATGKWERPIVDRPPFYGRVNTGGAKSTFCQAQATIFIRDLRSLHAFLQKQAFEKA